MAKLKKKLVLKFKVSNRNIRLRFNAEVKKNPEFTLADLARQFGALDKKGKPVKAIAWRWCESGTYSRIPNKSYKCGHCGKSQWDLVNEWINSGDI